MMKTTCQGARPREVQATGVGVWGCRCMGVRAPVAQDDCLHRPGNGPGRAAEQMSAWKDYLARADEAFGRHDHAAAELWLWHCILAADDPLGWREILASTTTESFLERRGFWSVFGRLAAALRATGRDADAAE